MYAVLGNVKEYRPGFLQMEKKASSPPPVVPPYQPSCKYATLEELG